MNIELRIFYKGLMNKIANKTLQDLAVVNGRMMHWIIIIIQYRILNMDIIVIRNINIIGYQIQQFSINQWKD